MKLTKNALKEYLDAELLIKKLEARKTEIREAILAQKKDEFKLGEYLVAITEFERTIPLPVADIRLVLKDRAEKVLQTVSGKRVQVRRVA